MSESHVLEIRRGSGDPRFLILEPGQELPPLSIGSGGDWRVDADGMEEVHAFVYFDGRALHVQSAVPSRPVKVNGRPVGTDWSEVDPSSTLAVADARLVYCPASQASAAASSSGPSPKKASRAPTPFDDAPTRMQAPAVRPDDEATGHIEIPQFDEEATRALPVPTGVRVQSTRRPTPPAGPRPEPPVVVAAPPPPPPPPPDEPPHLQTTTRQALRTKEESKLAQQWREASLPKKLILILLPLAFVMVIYGFDDDPPPPVKKKAPTATASSASEADKPPKKAKKPVSDDDETVATAAPHPTASTPPSAPPSTAPSAVASAPGSPKTDPAKKTTEREAVDAVAAGQYELAAKLYEALAKEHPEVPAYKEAARILRAKGKKIDNQK